MLQVLCVYGCVCMCVCICMCVIVFQAHIRLELGASVLLVLLVMTASFCLFFGCFLIVRFVVEGYYCPGASDKRICPAGSFCLSGNRRHTDTRTHTHAHAFALRLQFSSTLHFEHLQPGGSVRVHCVSAQCDQPCWLHCEHKLHLHDWLQVCH